MSSQRRPSVASQTFFKFGVDVTEKYSIGNVLGTGNYAEVRLGVNKQTQEQVAIKIVPVKPSNLRDILNEIDILARVDDHPHVIQLREIYETNNRMYIITELVTGGELFDRILEQQHFSESDARDVMRVLMDTVRQFHSYGIVHRDLKPENILYATKDPDSPIKIADFGLAKLWQPEDGRELKTLCGTPAYVAPEVLRNRQGYSPQCDAWSLGVILYILLCGYPPFQHAQQNKLFKQILKADFHFHSPWWDEVSDEAKDLVSRLLVVDPEKRLTIKDALDHPWMSTSKYGASVNVDKLREYVIRINKRKFRTITHALAAAQRLDQIGRNSVSSAGEPSDEPSDEPGSPPSPPRFTDLIQLPPPPPPMPDRGFSHESDDVELHPHHNHVMPPPPPPPLEQRSYESPTLRAPPPPPPLFREESNGRENQTMPPPPPPLEGDGAGAPSCDCTDVAECQHHVHGHVFSSEWVQARQESIVRRVSLTETLKKNRFSNPDTVPE